jgi:hypothetical protein
VALAKLAQAGEGAKFCDDSFAPSHLSLGSATLEAEVERWALMRCECVANVLRMCC